MTGYYGTYDGPVDRKSRDKFYNCVREVQQQLLPHILFGERFLWKDSTDGHHNWSRQVTAKVQIDELSSESQQIFRSYC